MAALALLAICVVGGCANRPTEKNDPPQAPNNPPKPPAVEIISAWKKAGAEVGWMRVNKSGFPEFLPEKQGMAGDLPAFKFLSWQDGLFAKLPAPTHTFGLDLSHTKVPNAGLKELAGLTTLQTLELGFTQVTDAGM
jgi:hypothetical protein